MRDPTLHLQRSLAPIPRATWCVGVSGGADSVGLLFGLRQFRPDLQLVVIHLDHESRAAESSGDAEFVAELAKRLGLEAILERRGNLTSAGARGGTTEAGFRAARLEFFTRAIADTRAEGVLLAHHADDRAENVVLRLLRGGEMSALGGLRADSRVNGIRLHRPMLGLRRGEIQDWLRSIGQSWREDRSNALPVYGRNRVRRFLRERPELVGPLLDLADASDRFRGWTDLHSPRLAEVFVADTLADLPDPLARAAARRWLATRGAPRSSVTAESAGRLIEMARDRSAGSGIDFPGRVHVRRQGKTISARQAS